MKYIYYVIAVMIIFSGLAAYGLLDADLEVSKPFISINDRIISQKEFEKMLARKPGYMTQEQFIDSVIEKQLLIQEAIKMDINKEESFRQSVENFYEQSLVKILVDRKLDSLVVDVSSDEIEKYRIYSEYNFSITKDFYPSLKDLKQNTNKTIETINADFVDFSDDLKFIIMQLAPGKSSSPHSTDFGVMVYTLDKMTKKQEASSQKEFNIKKVSLYIRDKKKEQLVDEWTTQIRQSAEIWRKK